MIDTPVPRDGIERMYLALSRFLPSEFRARFGPELLEFFRARRASLRDRGAVAQTAFLSRSAADLLATAWRERRPSRRPAGVSRPTFSTAARDDLRSAARRLRRTPSLTWTVVALLALTIGSATVVFSVVNAVLLRPLPFPAPDRVVLLWETRANTRQNNVGAHGYPVWVRRQQAFEAIAAFIYIEGLHLTAPGDPESVLAVRVAEPFFGVMGVAPAIGRAFTTAEDTPGGDRVAIISDRLWRARFAGDRSAIGRDVILDGRAHRLVGVMPPGFAFPPARFQTTPDVWVPIAENVEPYVGRHFLFVVGRLKEGITLAQARADLSTVASGIAKDFPDASAGHGTDVVPLQEHLVADVKQSLWLLLGAVGCLLLIGSSNVASLLLARGLSRRREIALELALGATRLRVARQLLVESLAMAAAGGALGVALAFWLIRLVPALVPPGLIAATDIGIDRSVLYFAIALSVTTGLLFGLAPAWQLRGVAPIDTLNRGGRSLVGGDHRSLRRAFVSAQIALAVLLVLGATLMVRGFIALRQVDPGFVTEDTLAVDLTLRGPRYAGAARQRDFFDAIEAKMAAMPGVLSAGAINDVPLAGAVSGVGVRLEGRPEPDGGASAQYRIVSPGYFKTAGVRFIAGRDFARTDARLAVPLIRWWPQQPFPDYFDLPQPKPVAIVNESMARRFWPGGAIDRRFSMIESPWITVVGVVADTHTVSLRTGTGPEFYLTSGQEPLAEMSLLVRASVPPLTLAPAVRDVIRAVDPALPIGRVTTVDQVVGAAYGRPAFMSALFGTFAGIALLLMTVGVYGLLSFTTARRLPEIGVRLALGAARWQIHRLVLRDALGMTAAGLVVGIGGSLALAQVVAGELYGVSPTDGVTYGAVAALVTAVVGFACWRPARRAARVDPVVVLKQE